MDAMFPSHVTARCYYPRHRQKFNNAGWNFTTHKYEVRTCNRGKQQRYIELQI